MSAHGVRAAAAISALLAVAGCRFDRFFLYFPDASRPDVSAAGVARLQEVTLATEDGLRLLSWWLPPSAGRPTIVYFHGNGGHIGYRAERLRLFARAGLGVLFLEYRGYGGNPGRPSEPGLYADARAALAFVEGQGIPDQHLVLYGESLGTGVAVRMASDRPVAALVLEAPYTSMEAVGAAHYPAALVRLLLEDRFDSLSRIGMVRAPLLVPHGERDDIIPAALGRALFAAAPEPKELWIAPAGGHNDLRQHGALDAVLDFLRRRVGA
jgi:hypothetical protein